MTSVIDFPRLRREKTERARAAAQDAIHAALHQADTIEASKITTGIELGDTQRSTLRLLDTQAGDSKTTYLDLLDIRVTTTDLHRRANERAVAVLESTLENERKAARDAAEAFEANERKADERLSDRRGFVGGIPVAILMIGVWIAVIFTVVITFRETGAAIEAAHSGSKLIALLFTPITSFISYGIFSLLLLVMVSGLGWVVGFVAFKITEGRAWSARQGRAIRQHTDERESDRRQRHLVEVMARIRALANSSGPPQAEGAHADHGSAG